MEIKPPVRSWSFSRLLDFESCPYRTYLRYVLKSPEPEPDETSPLVRGTRIHSEAEAYLRGTGELTRDLQRPKIVEHLDFCKENFEAGTAHVEEDWAFSKEWEITGWTSEDTWLRLKLDACVQLGEDFVQITDWKTGKSMGKEVRNMQQAQIYAVGVFMRQPKIQYVEPIFAYTDENKLMELKALHRKDVPRYIQRFTERANKLTSCTDFRAKPNRMNCRWCPFGPTGTEACVHGVAQ
jgi:RecB family exonuclease